MHNGTTSPESMRLLAVAKQESRAAQMLLNYLSDSHLQASLHVARGWELLARCIDSSREVRQGDLSAAIMQLADEPWMSKHAVLLPKIAAFMDKFRGPVSDISPGEILPVKIASDLLRESISEWVSSQKPCKTARPWRVLRSLSVGAAVLAIAYLSVALLLGNWNPLYWAERRVGAFSVIESSQEWGQLEINRSTSGGKLRVGGVEFEKGLGTHARSYVRLRLPYGSTVFQVGYGIDDVAKDAGAAMFRITAAGKELFNSGVVRGGQPAGRAVVPVQGLSEVQLIVERGPGNSNFGDHANWLSPVAFK